MLIHVRKIFNCKVSFNAAVKVPRNCCEYEHSCDQVVSEPYFQKNYHNSGRSRSYRVVLLPLVLNKK